MRSRLFAFIVAGFIFVGFAGAAQANDACYTWDCSANSPTCQLNASCSTITSGNLWKYRWDFGDGNILLTGNVSTSYTFTEPYPDVELSLVFYDVATVSESCPIVAWNAVSPPLSLSGTCY